MISFNTLGAFREAVKITQERLIKEDCVTVRGREVTVLRRIQKRTSVILVSFGVGAYVVLDVAYRSSMGSNAFQTLCWVGTFLAMALQMWRVWAELQYCAGMAWVAGCDVMWRRNMWAMREVENAGGFAGKKPAAAKESVKKLMKQELKSFFSRRHIAGYARISKFPLIWLLITMGITVYCSMFLHMWDTWPYLNRPFFVCLFCLVVALISLFNALQKWLEDMIVCAVFALTPAVGDDVVSR